MRLKGLQTYPNPFDQYLTIEYKVSDITHVNLSIFNIFDRSGTRTWILIIQWDALSRYNEMYIIQYKAGDVQKIQKVQLIR